MTRPAQRPTNSSKPILKLVFLDFDTIHDFKANLKTQPGSEQNNRNREFFDRKPISNHNLLCIPTIHKPIRIFKNAVQLNDRSR